MSLLYSFAVGLLVSVASTQCRTCSKEKFECDNGTGCCPISDFCDGNKHCNDGSDEPYAASYQDNGTLCRRKSLVYSRLCILPRKLQQHKQLLCRDDIHCTQEEFDCHDSSMKCIPGSFFCNGKEDCSDGSDEPHAASYQDNGTLCRRRLPIFSRLCILPRELQQRKQSWCRDNIHCSQEEFECHDPMKCIPGFLFCDGNQHCRDGSDEPPYATKDDGYMRLCRGKSTSRAALCLLPVDLEKDRDGLCRDDIPCSREEFECHVSPMKCIPSTYFCDGDEQCRDGSDEPYATSYQENGTLCRRRSSSILCILPSQLQEEKQSLCRDNIHCTQEEFECHDSSKKCIRDVDFCDGNEHCSGGSDENASLPAANSGYRMCFGRFSGVSGGFPCQLKEKYFCDGAPICAGGADEGLCGERKEDHLDDVAFRCFGNTALSVAIAKVCDGKFDCTDMTDECLCQSTERPEICERIERDGHELNLRCNESINSKRVNVIAARLCDNNSDCNYVEKEKHCVGTGFTSAACNGDARNCGFWSSGLASYDTCISKNFHCTVLLDKRQLSNFNPTSSRPWITCSVEMTSNFRCDIRYNCTNVQYLKKSTRECKIPDINDTHVVNYKLPCNCSYFGCDEKYIHEKGVCDGFNDCSSGIDECQPGCIVSAFSDEKSLITSKGVMALVWIFSIIAIIGCTAVVATTLLDIVTSAGSHSDSPHSNINKLLIMSLSISDLLVGIYTISICIKAIEVEGKYCYADVAWRTSTSCSILGALLIIGSEQSVLTMVMITKFRLDSVMRPFSIPKIKRAIMAVVVTWFISMIIALIPLMPSLEDYFLKDVLFNDTAIFKTKVNQNDKQHLIDWLGLLNKNVSQEHDDSTEWGKLRKLISQINKYSPIKATNEFGYYSSHTVCLPTFFPDRNKDGSWAYSFILLMLNFLAFVFMFVCYIVLYRKATNRKIAQSSTACNKLEERNAAMQRKLTRILASDFFCWIPVCIMGFLQLAGIDIPPDAYLPTCLLILPINSALNPFLYSDMPDRIMSWKRRFLTWLAASIRQWRNEGSSTEIPTAQVDALELNVIEGNGGDMD